MIRRRDDSNQDNKRISNSSYYACSSLDVGDWDVYSAAKDAEGFGVLLVGWEGDGEDGKADKEGVAEVEGGHRG